MINSIIEFSKEHKDAVIVNYDISEQFECGMTYRTSTNKVELFRKDKNGKYINYPYIQPYLTLSDSSNYELFIIHNSKMYKLEKSNKENTYKIKEELKNVSSNINKDDVFYDKSKRVNPRNNKEEPIYIIEE